jgi:tetratricopeptide (TPR) repeat protein
MAQRSHRFLHFILLAGALTLWSLPAAAYQFVPTEGEWNSWPKYCQARYLTTNIGGPSEWSGTMPAAEIENWQTRLGPDTFVHIHHYCAGLIYYKRSRTEANRYNRERMLRDAYSEGIYTYSRVPAGCPVCGEIAYTMAMIEKGLGDPQRAMTFLTTAIERNPKDPIAYSALAVALRDEKRLAEARDVLERGNTAVGGESAEIHYNLGLVYIELGDMQAAVKHAQRAYELNHPLPGLREKLRKLGYWQETQAAR